MRPVDIDPRAILGVQLANSRLDEVTRAATPDQVSAFLKGHVYLQYDPLTSVAPSHNLVLGARAPSLRRVDIDHALSWEAGVTEAWLRSACFVRVADYVELGQEFARRRQAGLRYSESHRVGEQIHAIARTTLRRVARRGPTSAPDLVGHTRTLATSRDARTVLNYLWYRGYLTIVGRSRQTPIFETTHRVLPNAAFDVTYDPESHQEMLARLALRLVDQCIVATARDIAWYFGQSAGATRSAVGALLEAEDLIPVEVDDWIAYATRATLDRLAEGPASTNPPVLLSPFDPLIVDRARLQRLTGVRFRAGLFTPASTRTTASTYPLLLFDQARPAAVVWAKSQRRHGSLLLLDVRPLPGRRLNSRHLTVALRRLARSLDLEYCR